ncbi:MAG TPA: HEAT repeat domain-containing protein [Candidatus Tectomicrobia bacterium]|jgi:HEAT repeat protein
MALLKDQEAFIRQGAFAILHTMQDGRTFGALVEALQDKGVGETVAALAALGDKRAVLLFLRMLDGDTAARLIAIRALAGLGEPQTVHPLLMQLQNPDPAVQQEVRQALAVLTNEAYAPDVLQAVMSVRDRAAENVRERVIVWHGRAG